MLLLSDRLKELNEVSPDVAAKLVDPLFRQTSSLVIGTTIFMLLGIIGFAGTGSVWYLGGLALAGSTGAYRLWQGRRYRWFRESASTLAWAKRAVVGGWITTVGWGAWSAVVLWEPNRSLVLMFIGAQSACMIGAAVRNCSVKVVAEGQVFMTLTPLFFVCLASDNIYLNLYAGFVALHIVAALALIKFLHQQTLQLLLRDEEKSDLVGRLEIANQELEVINQHLETLAATDALTAVANRRSFDLASAREWRRSARERKPMSVLLIDVDEFKAFNDYYGHQAGDGCLKEIAATAAASLRRPGDILARYGGEEFVVILPATTLDGAVVVAEGIRSAIEQRGLVHDAGRLGYVSVSIGAASVTPSAEDSITRLTAAADAALYRAKREGRNRVFAADVTQPILAEPGEVAQA